MPVFTSLPQLHDSDSEKPHALECSETSEGSCSEYEESFSSPKQFTQQELNDLIRDLNLSKQGSELLASRLKKKNCLQPDAKITFDRNRETGILPFFSQGNDLVYCNNIIGLLFKTKIPNYRPEDWRLFIDSSKRSLKCVLLHNGNRFASIPIAHSTKLKEEYDSIKTVLQRICYEKHQWSICVDLKMVNFLLGQQTGYTKYPCFMCLWDSRSKQQHWIKKYWPNALKVGEENIIREPLVEREKIMLPSLHSKLGLMKQFVKALDKNGGCLKYLPSGGVIMN